jgi:hypothetical protein
LGEQKVLTGIAYLEEDIVSKDPTKKDEFLDAHGLLLELQEEMSQLTNKDFTHVGIGFAFNQQKVKVVEMLARKPIMISHLGHTEDNAVEVRGSVLDKAVGIYAVRIVAAKNMKKELAVIGPGQIEFNRESGEFIATLKMPSLDGIFFNEEDPKFLEVYIQDKQVDKIKYGAEATDNSKINVAHLKISNRVPMVYFPDPRTLIEDDADRQKYERDMAERLRRQQQERELLAQQLEARKMEREKKREEMLAAKNNAEDGDDGDDMDGSEKNSRSDGTPQGTSSKQRSGSNVSDSQEQSNLDDEDNDFQDDDDEEIDEGVGDLPAPAEMQQELILAIKDEREEYE